MKTHSRLEMLLKTFFGIRRRNIKTSDAFDERVLNDALDRQLSAQPKRCETDQDPSVCLPCQNRWLKWIAAAMIVVAIGVRLMEKNPKPVPPEKPRPAAAAVASNELPTLFKMSMVLRHQGMDAAFSHLERFENEQDDSASGTALGMLRSGLAFNGNH